MVIPPAVFAVMKCAAEESTRYAINGVLIERMDDMSCRAVTTDGRRLMFVQWDDEESWKQFPLEDKPRKGFRALVPMVFWKHAKALAPVALGEHAPDGKLRLVSTKGGITATLVAKVLDGKFPDIDSVVPKYEIGKDAVEFYIDPILLAECVKALGDATKGYEMQAVRFVVPMKCEDDRHPIVMTATDPGTGVSGTVVLMGVKPAGVA